MYAETVTSIPWAPHPEVWLLVGLVLGLGVYVSRVIAPKVGEPVTGRQKAWFFAGLAVLWISSDWPLHDVAEGYLYSFHMIQHFALTMVMPPMFWLATPRWLADLAVPQGSGSWAFLRRAANPVVAAVVFNALVIASHWTVVVNTAVEIGPFHYLVHLVIVTSAFLMWIPVCGPWPQLRLSPAGQMVYLFLQSIIPTVPGAWLTLAEYPVYTVYDHEPRLWGVGVIDDQVTAGLIMKLLGGFYLWALIVFIFFRWALKSADVQRDARIVTLDDAIDAAPRAPAADSAAVTSSGSTPG